MSNDIGNIFGNGAEPLRTNVPDVRELYAATGQDYDEYQAGEDWYWEPREGAYVPVERAFRAMGVSVRSNVVLTDAEYDALTERLYHSGYHTLAS